MQDQRTIERRSGLAPLILTHLMLITVVVLVMMSTVPTIGSPIR